MRYLRKYNEELKSSTYKSAADKLAKIGHVKRPEELMKWHLVSREKEKDEAKRKAIEKSSKLGKYKITMSGIGRNNIKNIEPYAGRKFTGDFYVYFYLDYDMFIEYYGDWKSFDSNSLWIPFNFAVLPASEESKEFVTNVLGEEVGCTDGKCYLGSLNLNLSQGGNSYDENDKLKYVLKPNGGLYWDQYNDIDFYMADRVSAQKFKKMLYDIFEGNIVWLETQEIPGGVKEQVLDFLCSDMDHTLEEFEAFIESIKLINVNKLYKD
jgi:hypothetical protein